MSSSPKFVDMSVNMGGRSDLGATISARFAGTGRLITANAVFDEVDAWSRIADPRLSAMFARVHEALQLCHTLAEPNLTVLRGRSLNPETGVPLSECFGPPPIDKAPCNRYNDKGKPALYLCTTGSGVALELRGLPNIWVQKFVVPVGRLRIADLRSPETREQELLAAVMWFCELAGAEGHPSQGFSRLVASMVAMHFDGMLVSGVRGDAALLYSNLVILNSANEEWRKWLSPEPPTLHDCAVV